MMINVARQRYVSDFNVFIAPFVEQFHTSNLSCNFFGENIEISSRVWHVDFTGVGHDGRVEWLSILEVESNVV
jgi:hypothetical protein